MIPILYSKSETAFTSQGLGPLKDTILCLITEERNGQYEMELQYPVTGIHYTIIAIGCVIKATNNYCGDQLFDIYAISRPMNGIVTINAKHVSYRLNQKVLSPCSGSSVSSTLTAIGNNIMGGSSFTFWTDRGTTGNWSTDVPMNVRAALGGTEGSVLDTYGAGEYEWNNFTVKFHGSRGSDTGMVIQYGKNLLDLVADEDAGELYTACVPFFKAQDGTVTIANKTTTSEWSSSNDYTSVMDMSQYFQPPDGAAENWHPTTNDMQAKALALMNQNAVSIIDKNLKVEFALLSQDKRYTSLLQLERVKLCDLVTVRHPGMNVDVKIKVIKTVWNVLLDRYDTIELGEPRASLSETITKDLSASFDSMAAKLSEKADKTFMDVAIQNATDLLAGGDGGHVVLGRNSDGEPNEIFIMDTADTSTAVSVIRMNQNGIGFSSQGVNGPYTNAWTIDGHLVADFIDTGTLTASIIGAGTLASTDSGHNFSLDLSTGTMTMKNGSISLGAIYGGGYNFTVDNTGTLTASNAVLSGTLTSINGNYKSVIEDGFLKCYWQNTLVGTVGGGPVGTNDNGIKMSLAENVHSISWVAVGSNNEQTHIISYDRDTDKFRVNKPTIFADGSSNTSQSILSVDSNGTTINSNLKLTLRAQNFANNPVTTRSTLELSSTFSVTAFSNTLLLDNNGLSLNSKRILTEDDLGGGGSGGVYSGSFSGNLYPDTFYLDDIYYNFNGTGFSGYDGSVTIGGHTFTFVWGICKSIT